LEVIGRSCVFSGPLKTEQEDKALTDFAEKYALIVGVDRFQNKEWDLISADKEMTSLKRYLVNDAKFPRKNIKMLSGKNATCPNVLGSLKWLGEHSHEGDLVVVYVLTRGILLDKEHRKSALAFSDTTNDVGGTGIDMLSFVPSVLREIRSKGVVVVVNSDYSGFVRWGVMPKPSHDLLPPGHTLVIISSTDMYGTSAESKALGSTVFGYEFINALKCFGATNGIGSIAGSLTAKVMHEAEELDAKQSQTISSFGAVSPKGALDVVIGAKSKQ